MASGTIITAGMLEMGPSYPGYPPQSIRAQTAPEVNSAAGAVSTDQGAVDSFAAIRGPGAIAAVVILGIVIVAVMVFIVVMLIKVYRTNRSYCSKAAALVEAEGSSSGARPRSSGGSAVLQRGPSSSGGSLTSIRAANLAPARRPKPFFQDQVREEAEGGHVAMVVKPHMLPLPGSGDSMQGGAGQDRFPLRQPGDSLLLAAYRSNERGPLPAHPCPPTDNACEAHPDVDDKSAKLMQLERQESFVAVRLTSEDDNSVIVPPPAVKTLSRPGGPAGQAGQPGMGMGMGMGLHSREIMPFSGGPGDSTAAAAAALRTGGSYAEARRSIVASRRTYTRTMSEQEEQRGPGTFTDGSEVHWEHAGPAPAPGQLQTLTQTQGLTSDMDLGGASELFLMVKGNGTRTTTRVNVSSSGTTAVGISAGRQADALHTGGSRRPPGVPLPPGVPPEIAASVRRLTDTRPASAQPALAVAQPQQGAASRTSGGGRASSGGGFAFTDDSEMNSYLGIQMGRRSTAEEIAEQAVGRLLASRIMTTTCAVTEITPEPEPEPAPAPAAAPAPPPPQRQPSPALAAAAPPLQRRTSASGGSARPSTRPSSGSGFGAAPAAAQQPARGTVRRTTGVSSSGVSSSGERAAPSVKVQLDQEPSGSSRVPVSTHAQAPLSRGTSTRRSTTNNT